MKNCGIGSLVKIGFKNGVQKWRCKWCGKYQGAVDRREKYTKEDSKAALFLYLEGVGFRPAARILSKLFNKNFCNRTIMQWVKKAGRELEKQKETLKEEIKILEMDESYIYKKDQQNKSMDGSKQK